MVDLAEPNDIVATREEMLIERDDILPALPPVTNVEGTLSSEFRIKSRHERDPGGTTYCLVAVCAIKAETGRRELVDVGSDGPGSVSSKFGTKIVDSDEEDIGTLRCTNNGCEEQGDQEEGTHALFTRYFCRSCDKRTRAEVQRSSN